MKPIGRVWRVWRLDPLRHSIGAVVSWIAALVPGAQVLFTAAVVNAAAGLLTGAVSADRALLTVGAPLAALLAAQVIGRGMTAVAQYVLSRAELQVRQRLADDTMGAGLSMSQSDYEDADHYNRAKRALQEVQSGRVSALPGDAVELVASVVSIAAVAGALIAWMPLAALLILVSPVPGAIAAGVYGRKRWDLDIRQSERRRFSAYLQALTMSDHSHKEIAHYRLGDVLRARFRRVLEDLLQQDAAALRKNHLAVASADVFGIVLTCVALGLVVVAVAHDPAGNSLGVLTGFVQGMNTLYGITLSALGGIAAVYQSSLYAGNVFGYLDSASHPHAAPTSHRALGQAPEIHCEGVSFTYPGTDRVVLSDVDVVFPAGLCSVVVGANGSGKSTLLKLVAGVYAPTGGAVRFDGAPADEFDSAELNASIGVAFQDYVKYELPAYDNVAFGRIEQFDDQIAVREALRSVEMDDHVRALSRGWNTRLGRRFAGAEQLSIGQWQRLAFARAFRGAPSVLLADEPAASLDAEGEHAVLRAIEERRGRMTTILISHSLAAIHAADRIVYVDAEHGTVHGPAPHDVLLSCSTGYASMYRRLRTNAASEGDPVSAVPFTDRFREVGRR